MHREINQQMQLDDPIYIAGHKGMLGQAIWRRLQALGYRNLMGYSRSQLDLTQQQAVMDFFHQVKPKYVFLSAARVGGIVANAAYPAEFFYENNLIQSNIIHAAWKTKVDRLLFLGSSCIYPCDFTRPIQETDWLKGSLEMTNRSYAIAKIAGVEMCWAYYRQYGARFLTLMPTNMYGPGDHYDLQNSHVVPGLIKKFHEAKLENKSEVVLWGTGNPRRELMYCEDGADAGIFLMNLEEARYNSFFNHNNPPMINVGTGNDLKVIELAQCVAKVVGYEGKVRWDSQKPDGTMRKLLDSTTLRQLGWQPKISLEDGLALTYQDFKKQFSPISV